MGQKEVLLIVRDNDNITKNDIKVKYLKIFGELGSSTINHSLLKLTHGKLLKRKLIGKMYYYKENN